MTRADGATVVADRPRAGQQLSVVDLFTIGIGPSSSHTVGPMRAAYRFAEELIGAGRNVREVQCALYGSLALTGVGHATDRAVILGLMGWLPEKVDPELVPEMIAALEHRKTLNLFGEQEIPFEASRHFVWNKASYLPKHPNGMQFRGAFEDGSTLSRTFYSVGGGAIIGDDHASETAQMGPTSRYNFESAVELLQLCDQLSLSIPDVVRANELILRSADETGDFLRRVRMAMLQCIERGCRTDGTLPGGLNVKRRAKGMNERLAKSNSLRDPAEFMQYVSLWALAVNEENAAGGRVVTAPTNGAAGVIPAVLKYYETYTEAPSEKGSEDFLLAASAIGFLYKKRASISAAEVGCQGEVGVACSMAAAGLVAALGGSNRQIENAAEIGMEHNLGLTCDPIGGLVQIPCIERNTMGAIKAINAAYLAMHGDGSHVVSLDAVIETMRQTGNDMRSHYKETSLGGLAVNWVEC